MTKRCAIPGCRQAFDDADADGVDLEAVVGHYLDDHADADQFRDIIADVEVQARWSGVVAPGRRSSAGFGPILQYNTRHYKPTGCRLTPVGLWRWAVTYHMQMSRAEPIMDADDMRDADWAIVEVLRVGRANAPLIAEETGYSAQYIRERLGRLKEDDIVVAAGHGIYEINESEVPDADRSQNNSS